ncbi:MAG: ATP-dependent Clp protease adaptor ClpS [Anaerolineales bacterium]|nr:ATP-dependent Clp protease adaptor ClpS [Anaerolineales bacterium]
MYRIADWVELHNGYLIEALDLKLKRKLLLHHSTHRRVLIDRITGDDLKVVVSEYLAVLMQTTVEKNKEKEIVVAPKLLQGMDRQILPEINIQQKAAEEPPYRVIIHNDDVTPMDFVVHILLTVFLLAGPRAVQVMYTAHYHGSAYVCTLPKGEAQNRVARAHMSARLAGYPLEFTLEPE